MDQMCSSTATYDQVKQLLVSNQRRQAQGLGPSGWRTGSETPKDDQHTTKTQFCCQTMKYSLLEKIKLRTSLIHFI